MHIKSLLQSMAFILTLGCLMLVAISPFFADGIPYSDDGQLHIDRAIVLDHTLRYDGTIYPRYSSALAYGYGAPLFNYFPPTSYYPTVLFHNLGTSWRIAWKMTIALYVLLAGCGMYLWARQWLTQMGSLIAAVSYLYAPYALFDTVARGSSNEYMGMALLPFALWGFTRLAHHNQRRHFILAVLCYSLFILAHNVMTLYGSLLLVVYCLYLVLTTHNPWRTGWRLGIAGLLAILLTAFFWLPALLETDAVKINGILANLPFIDVTQTLRPLSAVFAIPQTADPTWLQAPIPISLSWIALALALIGFFLPQPPHHDNQQGQRILGLHLLLFFVLAIVIYSQLPMAAEVWQSVRLLRYSQFAWRPLSIASLALALLAAMGSDYLLHYIRSTAMRLIVFICLITTTVLYAVPWLYRPHMPITSETMTEVRLHEIESGQVVLSSYGEYLPVQTDTQALNPMRFLNSDSEQSRLQSSDSYNLIAIEEQSLSITATIEMQQAGTLVFDWLYVPGWQATIDDQRIPVTAHGAAGFVSIAVPQGQHEITIWYGNSTAVQLAWGLSMSALGLLAIILFVYRPTENTYHHNEATTQAILMQPRILWISASLLGLVLLFAKVVVIDRTNSPLRSAQYVNNHYANLALPINTTFANGMRLLGTQAISATSPNQTIGIELFWSTTENGVDGDYSTLLQLVNEQGFVIAEQHTFYPGNIATRHWQPTLYVRQEVELLVPNYTVPADYQLRLGVYDAATGTKVDVLNEYDNPIGVDVLLQPLTITRPEHIEAYTADPLLSVNDLDLLSIEGLPSNAQVGDAIELSWLWRENAIRRGEDIFLRWGDEQQLRIGNPVSYYPLSEWRIGDIWRGYHRFYVPAALPSGTYPLSIKVGLETFNINQQMIVTVPERDFQLPQVTYSSDAQWHNGIRLLGYDLIADDQIRLYWQTDQLIHDSLRLFVQLFDDNQRIIAIDDGYPVFGQRPTTSWVADEVIRTEHTLSQLRHADYHLLVGWYNPQSQVRIQLLDEDETTDAFMLSLDANP